MLNIKPEMLEYSNNLIHILGKTEEQVNILKELDLLINRLLLINEVRTTETDNMGYDKLKLHFTGVDLNFIGKNSIELGYKDDMAKELLDVINRKTQERVLHLIEKINNLHV